MNETYIVTSYDVIDKLLSVLNYEDDIRTSLTGAEILTVAVVAAKYFQNHHERALVVMKRVGDIGRVSVSRFNRCLHALRDWVYGMLQLMGEIFAQGEVFVIDSMPMPVCKRVRATRCRKVSGKACCGYCAAKRESFFVWCLHLMCSTNSVPVALDLLPAPQHDLTPIHELCSLLPQDACVYGDKSYLAQMDAATILDQTGVRLVSVRSNYMFPHSWADDFDVRRYCRRIETVYSQLESMGLQRLHAHTNSGFGLKAWASLLALTFTNLIDKQSRYNNKLQRICGKVSGL